MMESFKSFFRKNGGLVIAVALSASTLLSVGCLQPKIKSPFSGQMVTRPEFTAEIHVRSADIRKRQAALQADVTADSAISESITDEFDRRDTLITETLDGLSAVLVPAAGPYGPAVILGLGLLATGLGVDNRRKDGVIKGLKIKTDGA